MLIVINLRGTLFKTDSEKFKSFPNSRLAKLTFDDENYVRHEEEYYFDRNPVLFNFILDIYSEEELHLPKHVCSSFIWRELKYWKLPFGVVGKCCLRTVYADEEDLRIYKEYEELYRKYSLEEEINTAVRPNTADAGIREKVLKMLMYPNSSIYAKIYFSIIVMSVLLSITTFALSTLEDFRIPRTNAETFAELNITNPKLRMYTVSRPHYALVVLDIISNTLLFIDYILVVYSSRKRVSAVCQWFSICDLTSLVAVYIFHYLDLLDQRYEMSNVEMQTFSAFAGAIYCFRIVRVLRLLSHTKGMVALYTTFITNASVIIFFLVAFMTVSLLSASIIYQTEIWSSSSFLNLFSCIWWAVVTLSTVGYGDMVPDSVAGQIISVLIIVIGLLLIAIPFVIITTNYGNYYTCFENIRKQRKFISNNEFENNTTSKFNAL